MLSITHEILSFLQTNTSTSYKISFLFHFLLDIVEIFCIMPQDIPWGYLMPKNIPSQNWSKV